MRLFLQPSDRATQRNREEATDGPTGQGSRSEDRERATAPTPATGKGRQTMKNVKAIIDLFGGLASFRHVRLECKGFMPLVVEAIGPGPRGLPMVSVAHYYEQNGDLMKDPDMVFEVDA